MAVDSEPSGRAETHSHDYGHPHAHAHGLPHSHGGPALRVATAADGGLSTLAAPPGMSLLRLSIQVRLASAVVFAAVIWAAIHWASA